MTAGITTTARYSWGGDEYIFVELAEEMSLQANFRAMAITKVLRDERPDGVLEICPANASYQVRYDPDVIEPRACSRCCRSSRRRSATPRDFPLATRVVEIPVLYHDPWTTETLMRFRDRHQDPTRPTSSTPRGSTARDVDEFIAAHSGSPWFTSMVGFVAGLPFLYQMVARERQLLVPKYLRPRTDTPEQTVGYGGCFGCIYSVRGAGGYQMFGITPAPIYDPTSRCPTSTDFMVFFRPGDIVRFTPIDRERYDEHLADVEAGTFRINARPVEFSLQAVPRRPRRLQPPPPGGAECPSRSSSPGCPPPCRTPAAPATTTSGIPPSGALDQYSLRAANLLVGNPAARPRSSASTWAPSWRSPRTPCRGRRARRMAPKVDGEERPLWESFPVGRGRGAHFGYLTAGARAYIAVSGGIDVPEVLGSRSTYALGALGGSTAAAAARATAAGGHRLGHVAAGRGVPAELRPAPEGCRGAGVMGLYDHRLTDAGREAFLDTTWTLTPSPTAIGFRYQGRSWTPSPASRRSGRARTRRTSSTPPTRSGRSRCRAASSRSSCTATRCPAAAT